MTIIAKGYVMVMAILCESPAAYFHVACYYSGSVLQTEVCVWLYDMAKLCLQVIQFCLIEPGLCPFSCFQVLRIHLCKQGETVYI